MGQIIGLFRIMGQIILSVSGYPETDSTNMITGGNLTDRQIEDLSKVIASKDLASIAIKYLDLPSETVENIRSIRERDYLGFNRDLLILWKNKNPGSNQVQKLAAILFRAANEDGFLDPHKIQKILQVPSSSTMEETVTEADFLAIAEMLKPDVERRMKIEPYPWLRDHFVDMNKLYTELILEKIENEVLGEKKRTLRGYEEMFDCKGREKILIKGEPGMGKTTLGKKIGWDWAKGMFKIFSITFFVFLKFVQPGEPIENVIIKQNPEVDVSIEKLSDILDRFGDRCLLILDGLDEHGLGKNEDVLKIIRNEKLKKCGIIVSSRPHSTSGIENHFSVVVRINGFGENEARKFVSNFFRARNKIEQVMEFRPSDSREDFPIHQYPILLSFFCFLVAEEEVDLSNKTLNMGDIYTHLVKCLYKKYLLREKKEFKMEGFLSVMKSVGKLAIKTLTTNKPFLRRSEIDEFAFDYGLFAGHEDFRLLRDPTADFYVTYPHRSLEEFFGSFGFIQGLCEGKSVDDILGSDCEEPIFMVNPLVLRFCLWFLSTSDFDFRQKDECYDKLTSYVAKRIDFQLFDTDATRDKYPAINMTSAQSGHSQIQFFRDTLDKCERMTSLHVGNDQPFVFIHSDFVDNFFRLMKSDLIDRMKTIKIGYDLFKLKDVNNNHLTLSITVAGDGTDIMNLLLQKYNLARRNPQIYMFNHIDAETKGWDLTDLLSKYTKELYIKNTCGLPLFRASREFPHCPILTKLTIDRCHIDDSVPSALRRAINDGKLPCLRYIKLIDCKGKALRSDWPDKIKVIHKKSSKR